MRGSKSSPVSAEDHEESPSSPALRRSSRKRVAEEEIAVAASQPLSPPELRRSKRMMSQEEAEMRSGAGPDQSESLLSSVIGGLRAAVAGIFGSMMGGGLKTVENKNVKRKRLSGDAEDEENEDQPDEDQKRRRPDTVYEAVQQFINNLLGEKETKDSEDENMNTSSITYNTGEPNWNKKPDINFFSDSLVSSIHDMEQEGDIKTISTPQMFIEEEESGQKNVFIFSAEKSGSLVKKGGDNDKLNL